MDLVDVTEAKKRKVIADVKFEKMSKDPSEESKTPQADFISKDSCDGNLVGPETLIMNGRREDSNAGGPFASPGATRPGCNGTNDGPAARYTSNSPSRCGGSEKENSETPTLNIFQTDDLTFSDRLEAYVELFEAHDSIDVHRDMFNYLQDNIQCDTWKALWKIGKPGLVEDCDVLVEVDEALITLPPNVKAGVHLAEPFYCIMGGRMCPDKVLQEQRDQIAKLLKDELDNVVPLADLYPIFDESGMLDDTALAVEHYRFFYQNIWRPMDDDEGTDFIKQRLRFIYDVQEKKIPAHLVRKHEEILADYRAKHAVMRGLQGQLEDSNTSDVEVDMNESRIAADIMGLHEEIEVLKLQLEKLENPFLRSLMNIPNGPRSKGNCETRHARSDDSARTYLVAEKLTVGMIQDLKLPSDVIIEHCKVPGDALADSYDGDTILIFPGRYSGKGFYNLTQSVSIKGVGRREEVTIVCEELTDIFVDCSANSATIANLTLEDENRETWEGLVAIGAGSKVAMENCTLKSGGRGITIFRGGVLQMRGCEIKEMHIQESDEGNDRTSVGLVTSKVCDNQGSAVRACVFSQQQEMSEQVTVDVIGLLRGIDVTDIGKNDFSNNQFGEAILTYTGQN
ncbi:SHC SH2 domain-binding protein 1 homolog B-like [Diadema antillarum]|uniref:SHC SH2 domain-binding protein 1 homolog B-like n=1 Tax=Diadema antillarum TaxID=105358 RepID=UPI003A85F580